MRKILLYTFILFTIYSGLAQTSEAAVKLLDEVSETIATFDNLSFDFSYTLENRQENIKQETSGTVTVEGNKYKLMYLGAEQLHDGEKTYTIVIPTQNNLTA